MPVGVPKVGFLIPGDDEASWVELYNILFYRRILFLGQAVNSEVSNQLCGIMVYLNGVDTTRDLYLLINSPGGEVISGMAVFDIMQAIEADVQTICVGLAASMGSLLLVGGEITKRLAFPHARVMIHQPASSYIDGQAGESLLDAEEMLILHETTIKIYQQRTGKSPWQIRRDMHRDDFMSAEEAQAHGIVDHVGE
uniref:ATP-dependent Clp protease proteolytic subunit n=1 Tax=Trigonella foenum-graecum TaxID=78534 RepID=A0A4V1E3G6_TRIFG|nr:clp protease proteolytic subunit [Trigonella foenum-graecum]QCO74521.1 clp protease proteolytic subunit [Trigonella foenum-graecum]QJA26592.1 clp protease proteolytic subunit [Trigonella foenum-graecum]WCR63296.1 ATP-dependent Clp protease proteolytic subunit [Trigonella foenum-graecum]